MKGETGMEERAKYVNDLGEEAIEEMRAEVPPILLEGLDRYIMQGAHTGSFLEALLKGDLFEVAAKTGPHNLTDLMPTLNYIRFCLPGTSYGTPEKVESWLAKEWRYFQGVWD